MNSLVHNVSAGARTPVGLRAAPAAAAVRAGISRIGEHPVLTDLTGEQIQCARDARLDWEHKCSARMSALASSCLSEVVSEMFGAGTGESIALHLALPEARPGFSDRDALDVRRAVAAHGGLAPQNLRAEHSMSGHAGALAAMERAVASIQAGALQCCLVGGVDSYLQLETIGWLDTDLRLAREGVRAGFVPGEGAAMIALASEAFRKRMRLPSLAIVSAVANAHESRKPNEGPGLLGEALTDAVTRVCKVNNGSAGLVDDVYCDINGERARTTDWGFALLRVGSYFRDGTQYVTPVESCGDLGAAVGAFNCVLAVRAWQRHYASGARALVWGASWSGLRSAVLLESRNPEGR